MALATLDRRPPKLFHQGPTARSKLLLCAAAALVLMLGDARFGWTPPLRSLLAEETGLPVLVAEDPLTCVVRGCGMALERMEGRGSIFTSE